MLLGNWIYGLQSCYKGNDRNMRYIVHIILIFFFAANFEVVPHNFMNKRDEVVNKI